MPKEVPGYCREQLIFSKELLECSSCALDCLREVLGCTGGKFEFSWEELVTQRQVLAASREVLRCHLRCWCAMGKCLYTLRSSVAPPGRCLDSPGRCLCTKGDVWLTHVNVWFLQRGASLLEGNFWVFERYSCVLPRDDYVPQAILCPKEMPVCPWKCFSAPVDCLGPENVHAWVPSSNAWVVQGDSWGLQ